MALYQALHSVEPGEAVAHGTFTPTAGTDDIVTGLAKVTRVFVTLAAAPELTHMFTAGDVGDQAGTPDSGSFTLVSEKPTGTGDVTPIAATTPWVDVHWVAFGEKL